MCQGADYAALFTMAAGLVSSLPAEGQLNGIQVVIIYGNRLGNRVVVGEDNNNGLVEVNFS